MAILVDKSLEIMGGITIPQVYIRLAYSVNKEGTEVMIQSSKYVSKESYQDNPLLNEISISNLKNDHSFNYDRDIDGSDILLLAHEKFSEILTTDVTKEIPLVDPSTGDEQYDPSTGEILTETVLNIPKFADELEVSIVDVSIG